MIAGGVGQGSRVLFPCAAGAREALPTALRLAGAVVDEAVLYDTVPDPIGGARLAAALAEDAIDAITLASPSAVEALLAHAAVELVARARLVTIGPTTSEAVRDAGLPVAAEARRAGAQALAMAVAAAFNEYVDPSEDLDA
jgi:uroporphyrinogen-III synthase